MTDPKARVMRFRQWIICEDLKTKIIKTRRDRQFPETVFAYLSVSIGEENVRSLEWDKVVELFSNAIDSTGKIYIPIVKDAPKGGKEPDWNYPGRTFSHYANIIAGKYGWSLEYISELEVNQAFALVQEILTDEFLDREFEYSLSEVAYPYNKSTKKSVYKPMERPYWMRPIAPMQPKKVKMRKDTLPVGRVLDVSGLPPEFQIEGFVTEKVERPEKLVKEKSK